MYNKRLQILLSPEQRRRLEHEAARTGASVASLVRDAIDERFGRAADRREAYERFVRRRVPHIPPPELRELIDSRFDPEHP